MPSTVCQCSGSTSSQTPLNAAPNKSTTNTSTDQGSAPRTNCACNRVMSWADNWISLPYCRRGNGIDNGSNATPPLTINKVKLSGEGKMPVVQPSGELAIYATVDLTKKKTRSNRSFGDSDGLDAGDADTLLPTCECEFPDNKTDSSNYINLVPPMLEGNGGAGAGAEQTADSSLANYANLEFAQSLENYENAKEVLQKAGFAVGNLEETLQQCLPHARLCAKCGHVNRRRPQLQGSVGSANAASKSVISQQPTASPDDRPDRPENYVLMEPGRPKQTTTTTTTLTAANGRRHLSSGYVPMSPATATTTTTTASSALAAATTSASQPPPLPSKDLLLLHRRRLLAADKSASNPSLCGGTGTVAALSSVSAIGPAVDRSRKRVSGSCMMSLHNVESSPYTRRLVMDNTDALDAVDKRLSARKRSSSADSSSFANELDADAAAGAPVSPAATNAASAAHLLRKSSLGQLESVRSASPCLHRETEHCHDDNCCPLPRRRTIDASASLTLNNQDEDTISISTVTTATTASFSGASGAAAVHIRRSASVPCKSQNRDSSSSNDSGVSTGSMRATGQQRFAAGGFELPLTTAQSMRRHQQQLQHMHQHQSHNMQQQQPASLPRRSKSFDPLRDITFQFKRRSGTAQQAKCSSAEAEIPLCPLADSASTGTGGSAVGGSLQSASAQGSASAVSAIGSSSSSGGSTAGSSSAGVGVPYMDSRSSSSGTSDMSDYIETLSLSSHSSSDAAGDLR